MNYEDDVLDENGEPTGEKETAYPDDIVVDETESFIRSEIEDLENGYFFNWVKDSGELRSYPSSYLGSLRSCKSYGDIEVDVYIHALIRSGYYEGACLDWTLQVDINGYGEYIDDGDIPYAVDDIIEHASTDMNKGLLTIMARKAEKWIRAEADRLSGIMENIFSRNSEMELKKVAQFSNGETIYKRIES
jgi:hypothetical protein